VHVQKQPFGSLGKILTSAFDSLTPISCRLRYFGDLRTFSIDSFIGKSKSPPYFYFRFIWPTDLESVPRDEPPTMIISTTFEVDKTIHCRVIALLLLIHYVTLTFWCWTVVIHVGSRDQPWIKFEDPMPIHSWLMSCDVCHRPHWQRICSHCVCTLTLDPYLREIFTHIFEIPQFVYSLFNLREITCPVTPICPFTIQLLLGLRWRLRVVYRRACPMLKPFSGKNF